MLQRTPELISKGVEIDKTVAWPFGEYLTENVVWNHDQRKDTLMSKHRKLTGSTRENRLAEAHVFAGDLDAIAREGVLRMLISTLETEVTEFLGRAA